jgi:hypothetical protein
MNGCNDRERLAARATDRKLFVPTLVPTLQVRALNQQFFSNILSAHGLGDKTCPERRYVVPPRADTWYIRSMKPGHSLRKRPKGRLQQSLM